jgi:hypothetical protein
LLGALNTQIGEMDTIEATLSLSKGSPGTDNDPDNPLSRALNRLFIEGRPFNSLALCYYGAANTSLLRSCFKEVAVRVNRRFPLFARFIVRLLEILHVPTSPTPSARWLGALVHSVGNRIIFFPGFSFSLDWIRTYTGSAFQAHSSFQIDHISLDEGFQRWHFTDPDSNDHLAAGHTESLGEGRFLWFGMSIADPTAMRELRTKITVRAPAPPSDVERRLRSFQEAYNRGTQHKVSLDPRAKAQFENGFLHFSFIVSPARAPIYRGARHAMPFGSPFLIGELPNPMHGLPMRAHQVRLAATITIQITAMWLPGALTVPVTFTTHV